MTAATTSVGPAVSENGLNSLVHGHITMNMPRFHPIAINPHHSVPHDPSQGLYRHTPYGPPPPVEQGPPPAPAPPPHSAPQGTPAPPGPPLGPQSIPSQLDQIEARLRQLEHEDAARTAARSHLLAIRKREDEEFRMITESAEAEEEVRIVIVNVLLPRFIAHTTNVGSPPTEKAFEAGIHGTLLQQLGN